MNILKKGISIIFAVGVLIISVVPFYFMVVTSFKEPGELYSKAIWSLPDAFSLDNYTAVLDGKFQQYLWNSIFIIGISVVLILALSATMSYSLVRIRFRASGVILAVIVACMAIPVHVTLIPVYLMSNSLGLYDTVAALIGPYVAFNIPMSVFILSDFMRTIPDEIEAASFIDGCSRRQAFLHVFLPMSVPGLVTLAIYNAIQLWGEFLFALVLTQSDKVRTLPLGIWEFQGAHQSHTPRIMAFLTLSSLVMIVIFILGQDKIIEGMTVGAVKE